MKRYIIDGYNALFSLQKGDPSPTLEKARMKLISFLEEAALFLSERNSVCIVIFDAHERDKTSDFYEPLFNRGHKGQLEIVYTGFQQTADAYIEQFFISLGKKSTDCLISSDKRLCRKVTALGFVASDISTFFSQMARKMMREKKREKNTSSFKQTPPQSNKKTSDKKALSEAISATPPKRELKSPAHPEKIALKPVLKNDEPGDKLQSLPHLGDVQGWQSIFEELLKEYDTEASSKKLSAKGMKKKKK